MEKMEVIFAQPTASASRNLPHATLPRCCVIVAPYPDTGWQPSYLVFDFVTVLTSAQASLPEINLERSVTLPRALERIVRFSLFFTMAKNFSSSSS